MDFLAADDGDEGGGATGGCRVLVACMTAMAVATAREPASHKFAWNNLKQATPIIAERTCPPIKFRG